MTTVKHGCVSVPAPQENIHPGPPDCLVTLCSVSELEIQLIQHLSKHLLKPMYLILPPDERPIHTTLDTMTSVTAESFNQPNGQFGEGAVSLTAAWD
jgi:hypothetical protein